MSATDLKFVIFRDMKDATGGGLALPQERR
jgi:hypothetical protein